METNQSTLVILPGLDGTDVFFRPFLALLPASIQPIVVCYPHEGPNGYHDLLAIACRAVAGISEFYVLGSSFSGPLAIMLAAAHPQKVRGIILSATFLRSPRPGLTRWKFAARAPVIRVLRAVRRLPVWLFRAHDDPFRRAKAETWKRVSARCLAVRLRAVIDIDVRSAFRDTVQPVMCVVFVNDRLILREYADEMLRHRPSARVLNLAGEHFAMYTDPAPFTAEIVRFIGSGNSV